MNFRSLADAWNRAFFEPRSPIPLAVYRILFGALVSAKLLLLAPDWLNWFGPHAWVSLDTMHALEPGRRFNLFDFLPESDLWTWAFFGFALISALLLALGLFTRIATVCVFLTLVSIDERALYTMNAGDSVLRISAFFLIFAPAGAALSVDRQWRVRRGLEPAVIQPRVIWAQRMIQYLAALVYLATVWWKLTGKTWIGGTALYYVQHLEQFQRFPMPSWIGNPVLVKLETWAGLIVEFSLGALIWFKPLRYWVLLAGLLLHLTLEYSMNVPLFQFVMLATLVLFVDPADLARLRYTRA